MGYDTERQALYDQYQEASRKITLLSCRDLAEMARKAWPTAAYVVLMVTDQGGDYLTIREVLDANGDQLGEGEDFEIEADADEMETAGNLHTDSYGPEFWMMHCLPMAGTDVPEAVSLMANRRAGFYVLVIDSALTIDPASFAV